MKTIYTIKFDESGCYLVAFILKPKSNQPERTLTYDDIDELQQVVKSQYGEDAQRVSSRLFDEQVASRQIHTPAICTLLSEFSEIMRTDLSRYTVYGSAMRPMTAAWAHIPDAVYMSADKATTGFHTYIAVPRVLSSDMVASYELTFVSRPGEAA